LPDTLEDEIKAGFFEFRRKFSTNEPSQYFISHALLHQKHPFFRKLSIETVKFLISQHLIKNIDPGQQLYGRGPKRFVRNFETKTQSELMIYFVIFGRLTIRTKRKAILGGKAGQVTIGCTLGEEKLYDFDTQDERAVAETQACLLGLSIQNYLQLKEKL
jgi:hypothetical protein